MRDRPRHLLSSSLIACVLIGLSAGADALPQKGDQSPASDGDAAVDPKWLERLPREDRDALDPLIGYAAPEFTSGLKWVGSDPQDWHRVRGRVVVVQSFTTGSTAGRKWPERIAATLKGFETHDVAIFALHTPEDAAEAEAFLTRQPPPRNVPVIIDSAGEFCDSLGVFKHPVNIVVDRHGQVRYAGLNANGLEKAVAALVAERFDDAKQPAVRPVEKAGESASAEFPPIKGSVGKAKDLRGQRAPEFYVDEWVTSQPSPSGKVVVLDFWATSCPPCVASIPHMNKLVDEFGDKACFVGISDERPQAFESGLKKAKLTLQSFKYALALDPSSRMYKAVGISAIPHCMVISQDWVVRWQGHPTTLKEQTLKQIIEADQSAGGSAGAKAGKKNRGWMKP
jgi:thiol-disulfide isomerase/thioredoxin